MHSRYAVIILFHQINCENGSNRNNVNKQNVKGPNCLLLLLLRLPLHNYAAYLANLRRGRSFASVCKKTTTAECTDITKPACAVEQQLEAQLKTGFKDGQAGWQVVWH